MRAVFAAASVACALLLAGCGGGGSPAAPRAAPPGAPVFLGVSAGDPLLAPGFALRPEIALMARSGVQSLRVPFYWRNAQPYRSSADVPAAQRRHFVEVRGVGRVRRSFGFDTTEADQAVRLDQAIRLLTRFRRPLGLERIYWESWITYDRNAGNPFDFSGLREQRPDGTRDKAALAAFRRVALGAERCLRADPAGSCG